MSAINISTLYNNFQKALENGNAAIFAGAGLSVPAGFVNWKELLRDIARDLDLDVDKESDLIALAQYKVNKNLNRAEINQKLVEEYTKDAKTTENHRLIAGLPIQTIWTTNYDHLLEDAFKEVHKRVDVKMVSANFGTTLPKRDVVIYKMHGDISLPHEAIVTKEDYEMFHINRNVFSIQLQGDLISKTFLFLGLSFTDPNIDYILGRIRALLDTAPRDDYCILRKIPKPQNNTPKAKANYEYETAKLNHRILDLKRYGIQTVFVDSYSEITDFLKELNKRIHRKNIFVSGSAHKFEPFGKEKLDSFLKNIGKFIIEKGYNLVSGLGLGIGSTVSLGAIEALYRNPVSHIDERTILRPFPQDTPNSMTQAQLWTRYREEMISKSGFAIFVTGNKLEKGKVISAPGVREEFDICKKHGVYPIPVGATGHTAREIWEEMNSNIKTYFGKYTTKIKSAFHTINKSDATDEQLINSIFEIITVISTDK